MITITENNTPSVNFESDIDKINMQSKVVWEKQSLLETTLVSGGVFNTLIKDWKAAATSFTKSSLLDIPSNAIDISDAKDRSIVMWYDSTSKTVFWYSDCLTVYLNSDASRMFIGCSRFTSIDLSQFDTSKVTNMNSMFNGCSKLTSLDLSHFDTSNATSMNSMFRGGTLMTSFDVSSFDTSNVIDMRYMFSQCATLTNIYGPKFVNTSLQKLTILTSDNGSYGIFYPNLASNRPEWTDGKWDQTNSLVTFVKNA